MDMKYAPSKFTGMVKVVTDISKRFDGISP